jgi:crotonobetainyl-CoA:carnitine CoA-transferase CaiB-like acyl-CoA transferase
LAALLQREKTGRRQLVDVSMQEAHLMATMSRVGQWSIVGGRGRRAGALMRVGETVQREIWPCKDGYVSFGLRGGPARIPGLKRMVAWMDEEGLAPAALKERDWDSYNHNLLSQEEVAEISEPIAAFFMTKTMTELYDAALTRGLMLAPANTAREILASRQYASRDLFVQRDDRVLGSIPLVRSFVVSDAVPGVQEVAP